MPRASEKRAEIEAERLALLHNEQRKLRRRITKEVKVKKQGHQPGEEALRKHTAVLLKIGVPNISYGEIADRLGETRATVRTWFKEDPDVKDFYSWAIDNLKDGALALMKTYSLEAVETLTLLMRFGSEKYMFEASREILDRIGVPKVERHEVEREDIHSHKWADRDQLVSEIRELPPDQQEAAVEALEKFEELLAKNSPDANNDTSEDNDEDDNSEDGDEGSSALESIHDDEDDPEE